MKRFFALGLVVLLVGAGCSSDDDVFTPGDPDDPDYQGFTQEFSEVDELTGEMANMAFDAIDAFTGPTAGLLPTSDASYEDFTWSETNNRWEGSWSHVNEEHGISFEITGTVQFYEGSTVAQYPGDNTTRVVTTVNAGGTGTGFESTSSQNITVDRGVDVLTINGSGHVGIDYTRTDELQTTTCTGSKSFNSTLSNILIPDNGQGVNQCPTGGSVTYSGSLSVECTGASPWSHTGQWSVQSTFGDGEVSHRYTRGRRVWNETGSCE